MVDAVIRMDDVIAHLDGPVNSVRENCVPRVLVSTAIAVQLKPGRRSAYGDHRFEGRYCELDRDECSQRPCPSDATCVNHVPRDRMDKGFSCLCPTGYTGEFCEIEVDLCDVYKKQGENYCENEGICEARYVCICQDGFGGSRCSHRVPYFSEYEKFGCLERPEVCAKVFDNGHCDEVCNRESCLFDGFDCVNRGFVCRNPSGCAYKYGDGNCDQECAGAECGFDGGDCNDSKNMSHNQNVNMIGVALALPPDVAVKSLRQLQSELAQHLYTHVGIARDVDGVMVYEWSADHGEGSRVVFGEEVARVVNTNASGTIIFFDVDTSACRLKSRKKQLSTALFHRHSCSCHLPYS
ncbi:hypothetical protein KIN20_028116 [Parelaphostrongylus tenuis]|uniref:Uncharacterized protein n=1 Tax=Parelaphostrongylus tenuis TaxID=148309 RepID=A0AAD5R0G9_PARTN|nr:hypothetical protein KIN20_028116 [Parelaphostrongylus tenuis]